MDLKIDLSKQLNALGKACITYALTPASVHEQGDNKVSYDDLMQHVDNVLDVIKAEYAKQMPVAAYCDRVYDDTLMTDIVREAEMHAATRSPVYGMAILKAVDVYRIAQEALGKKTATDTATVQNVDALQDALIDLDVIISANGRGDDIQASVWRYQLSMLDGPQAYSEVRRLFNLYTTLDPGDSADAETATRVLDEMTAVLRDNYTKEVTEALLTTAQLFARHQRRAADMATHYYEADDTPHMWCCLREIRDLTAAISVYGEKCTEKSLDASASGV